MKSFLTFLKLCAVAGNVLFMLWMSYNAIDEGFRATPYQLMSYVGLAVLLILNSVLLFMREREA